MIYRVFLHPRWCRISSIDRSNGVNFVETFHNLSQNDKVFFYQLPKNNNVYSPLNELNAKFTIKNVMFSQAKYLAVQ